MRKFTQMFEKKLADGVFNREAIEHILKQHDEIDIITNKGDRYFIAPFMHKNGKMAQANDIALTASNKAGKQVEILYTDIKTIDY
jgi:hypothetical protein